MGFSRKEYWSGLPWPPPGDLPDPGIEPGSPAWAGGFFTAEPAGKPPKVIIQLELILELIPVPLLNFHFESSASGNVIEFFQLPLICIPGATFQFGK